MPGGTSELADRVLDEAYARPHTEVALGDYARVAVPHTWHGMPPDLVARAFELLFTNKLDGRAPGWGLAMVFGCVELARKVAEVLGNAYGEERPRRDADAATPGAMIGYSPEHCLKQQIFERLHLLVMRRAGLCKRFAR